MNLNKILLIILAFLFLAVSPLYAAGTVGLDVIPVGSSMKVVVFSCTGDSSDGTVPSTSLPASMMANLKEFSLCHVRAYPTPGGSTPTTAASITLTNSRRDLLGGTGAGLIPIVADTEKSVNPYNPTTELYGCEPIYGDDLTLTVGSVGIGKQVTIEAIFQKP